MGDLVLWASVASIVGAVFTVLQYFKRHDRLPSDLSPYPIDHRQDRPLSSAPRRAIEQQPGWGFLDWILLAGGLLASLLTGGLIYQGLIDSGVTHDDAIKVAIAAFTIGVVVIFFT